MRKNKLLLLLALLMTAATGAWAQTVVTIGNGTDNTSFVPYCSSYKNSLVEQIYLASEIGQSGIITAISFNIFEQQDDITNSVDVYMKNVTRSSFSSTTDYEPLAASDMVFSGSVNYKQDGWNTITLDTPFEYDNTKNLLICLYKKGSTKYSIYNYYTTQTENRTIAFYHDTNVPDPYNLGSYPKFISVVTSRADIKITMEDLPAPTYSVTMKDGVKDAGKWTVKVGEGQAQALPVGGLSEGQTVTLQYNGRLKVKSVTATSDAVPAKEPATVTTAPKGAEIVGVGKTTALVSGGVADGGTLWYAVTTTNTKPTSTAGFSDAVPTAKDITASGMVYVWYYVKADDTHSDSEIAATAIEVPVADIVWDRTNVSDLAVDGYVSYEMEGVTLSANVENIFAWWKNYGDPTRDGIGFEAYETGGFTFTAPSGKAFTKIEMKPLVYDGWDEANLGTGWAYNNSTVTWKGTAAASTVDLLKDTDSFDGARVKSIAFYLSE